MWSIRMRASKNRAKRGSMHISGAETICTEQQLKQIAQQYIKRALSHSRGNPDEVVITVERITKKPLDIPLLNTRTAKCSSPDKARQLITEFLLGAGVSARAVNAGLKVLYSKKHMRGACIMLSVSGRRAEPDRMRGVRVSRFGMTDSAEKIMTAIPGIKKSNIRTVTEAITLASKTAHHADILAEVCISDDPDYTTGYAASKQSGYLRIPCIKQHGDMRGGRVIFVRQDADITAVVDYLEKRPVIVSAKKVRR
ncbi:MAG: 6-carboxyhexanoate--CoA ligase [Nitrospiraceae bacterium]|nr:6-carboxyhexanoate--CoA ligase [Nitrospiraceae bacterium]